ncbi:hypothetical protein LguiA_017038 [Lonicera macranthoides]
MKSSVPATIVSEEEVTFNNKKTPANMKNPREEPKTKRWCDAKRHERKLQGHMAECKCNTWQNMVEFFHY